MFTKKIKDTIKHTTVKKEAAKKTAPKKAASEKSEEYNPSTSKVNKDIVSALQKMIEFVESHPKQAHSLIGATILRADDGTPDTTQLVCVGNTGCFAYGVIEMMEHLYKMDKELFSKVIAISIASASLNGK